MSQRAVFVVPIEQLREQRRALVRRAAPSRAAILRAEQQPERAEKRQQIGVAHADRHGHERPSRHGRVRVELARSQHRRDPTQLSALQGLSHLVGLHRSALAPVEHVHRQELLAGFFFEQRVDVSVALQRRVARDRDALGVFGLAVHPALEQRLDLSRRAHVDPVRGEQLSERYPQLLSLREKGQGLGGIVHPTPFTRRLAAVVGPLLPGRAHRAPPQRCDRR
ncbi:MAG: hypothetical protein Q8Q09_06905 [Deltaproteobacteria bacterium]|nr:hypothetical protein [Deltaproteobacteria bacterium]